MVSAGTGIGLWAARRSAPNETAGGARDASPPGVACRYQRQGAKRQRSLIVPKARRTVDAVGSGCGRNCLTAEGAARRWRFLATLLILTHPTLRPFPMLSYVMCICRLPREFQENLQQYCRNGGPKAIGSRATGQDRQRFRGHSSRCVGVAP